MTTFYISVFQGDADTTDRISEFSEQSEAEKALPGICTQYPNPDYSITCAVVDDGLHHWVLLGWDATEQCWFEAETVFAKLMDYVRTVDRSELKG